MLPTSGGSTSTTTGGAAKMRMVSSCSGCRALRKGCSDDCTIRPCLQWIEGAEAQGNATHFLAKFYGRAGLLNLIAAAAPGDADADADRRPAVFRSMLYEACGRIVNPVYGAVGLLWSGQWQKCVDAVEAVLKGDMDLVVPVGDAVQPLLKGDGDPKPVVEADAASSEAADAGGLAPPPLGARRPGASSSSSAAYDIRHKAKDSDAAAAADLLRFARASRAAARTGFKRAGAGSSSSNASKGKGKLLIKGKATKNVHASPSPPPLLGQQQQQEAEELEPVPMVMELLDHDGGRDKEFAGSHYHHLQGLMENTDVEAAASHVIQAEAEPPVGGQVLAADQDQEAEKEVGLELTLTLGFEVPAPVPVVRQQQATSSWGDEAGSSGLGLQLPPA